jgi:hypothetical protein
MIFVMCQASKWMFKHSVFDNFPEDCAAQLHLVNTVLGLEEAEKMFKNIPEKMRDYSVLLSSYTKPVQLYDLSLWSAPETRYGREASI